MSFIYLITAIAELVSFGKNFLLSSTPTAKLDTAPIQSVLTVPYSYLYYGIYLTELQLCVSLYFPHQIKRVLGKQGFFSLYYTMLGTE